MHDPPLPPPPHPKPLLACFSQLCFALRHLSHLLYFCALCLFTDLLMSLCLYLLLYTLRFFSSSFLCSIPCISFNVYRPMFPSYLHSMCDFMIHTRHGSVLCVSKAQIATERYGVKGLPTWLSHRGHNSRYRVELDLQNKLIHLGQAGHTVLREQCR